MADVAAAGGGLDAARLLASSSAPELGAPADEEAGEEEAPAAPTRARNEYDASKMGALQSAFSHSKGAVRIGETARAFFDMVEETLSTKRQLDHVAKRDDPKNYAAKFATFEHTARQQDLRGKNPLAMTLDDVFAAAEAAYDTFRGEMRMLAGSANAELVMAPLKTRERAEAKVRDQYDGMNCRINDVVRCSIVCDSEIELVIAGIGFASLVSTCAVSIVRLKNYFHAPRWNGYRDALYTVRVKVPSDDPDVDVWHNCECQLHLRSFYGLSPSSVAAYAKLRPYFLGQEAVHAERTAMLGDLHRAGLCGIQPLVRGVPTKLQNSLGQIEVDSADV